MNCHLRHVIKKREGKIEGKEHEEDGLSTYLVNLRKPKDTGN
jgi:hypothetical protein